MGIKTKIEWTDSSVNPIMGCTGCALRKSHCYAAALCARYAGRKGWPKSFDRPEFFPGRLEQAVKWSDLTGKARPDEPWLNGLPRHVFVNDLSDGFCPDADPWQWLAPSIPSMHLSPHVWMLLTKWPDRMNKFFREWGKPIPSNFYLGISAENQDGFDARWDVIRELVTIASVLFFSLEPLLDKITLPDSLAHAARVSGTKFWLITGGESGPGARPSHPDWHRATRDFCQANEIAYFFKAWGEWMGMDYTGAQIAGDDAECFRWSGVPMPPFLPGESIGKNHRFDQDSGASRIGKKRAGHLLDGRAWQEFPADGAGNK